MKTPEEIKKGLECCMDPFNTCGILDNRKDCQYSGIGPECMHQMFRDAITLLKAQEPVKPQEYDPVVYGHKYFCGKCHHKIWRNDNFCPNCGRKAEWE